MPQFYLPDDRHRTTLIGQTGSGKSVLGCHILSWASIDRIPWLIIDHKGEEIFDLIDYRAIREIRPGASIPNRPGLYLTSPVPGPASEGGDDENVERMLWKIWYNAKYKRRRCGIYIDEMVTMPDCNAVDTCLIQGRSLGIPMIMCSQRPVGISRYVFTQSNFIACFNIENRKDQIVAEDYLNVPKVLTRGLPEYHCIWRDGTKRETMMLQPCPAPDNVVQTLNARAPHRIWW